MNYHIDPITFFGTRKLKYTPPHFVVSKVPATRESIIWIFNNCVGRFSIETVYDNFYSDFFPAFEDPKEEMFYTLRWG